MEHRTIAEVMTPHAVQVGIGARFKDIASLLAEYRISGVPVVGPDGRVIGVISESDLMTRQARLYEERRAGKRFWRRPRRRGGERAVAAKARALTAGELMSSPAITVQPQDSLVQAARVMERHRVERLPVVDDDGRLAGIVTRRDLLQIFLRTDREIRTEVIRDVLGRTLWLAPENVHVTVRDGVVMLAGQLERRSKIPIALRLTSQVDGVIAVIDKLTWRVDDSWATLVP
jgi:CBS domain-containing protein